MGVFLTRAGWREHPLFALPFSLVSGLASVVAMAHGYDSGRLNLPFVGIATFGKYPYQPDWSEIDADVCILGAPFDFGTQWRAGARFGPRAIRDASTLFAFGHAGAYDHEDGVTYLGPGTRILDLGDADIVHTDTEASHAKSEDGVRQILAAGALPVVLGGDHSVNIPCIRAFDDQDPIHIVQIDAHLDFVDERHGVRHGHGNPLRRAAARDHVSGLSRVPADARLYLTIDIDGFDPSIAPGTGTPSHGGFLYYEVLELLAALAARQPIVGLDLVEVAPDYDRDGTTAILAAQLLLNVIGRILHRKKAA